MSRLRSLLITVPLCVVATIVYGVYGVGLSFFDPSGDRQMRLARKWGSAMCAICRIRLEVEGLDRISPDKHYIFCPNHLSYTDTPVILASLPMNFRFMAKQELFKIPFLGTHLQRAGHISVPLEDPRASIKALSHAARIINERSISVLIFPEGDGPKMANCRSLRKGRPTRRSRPEFPWFRSRCAERGLSCPCIPCMSAAAPYGCAWENRSKQVPSKCTTAANSRPRSALRLSECWTRPP